MATILICPKCERDMHEQKPNVYICKMCLTRWEQLTIDGRRHRLVEARIAAGFKNVPEAAKALGYNTLYLRLVEKGSRALSETMVDRMVVVYGCERGALID